MARKKRSLRERRKKQHAARVRVARLRWGAVVGLVLLVTGALIFTGLSGTGTPVAAEVSPANTQGPADASVSVVEFGDFGCPSCRAWHNSGIKARLQAEFGDQISFTFRHFPVITRQSAKAAEAAQCAADQGAFWRYHDYLYEQAGAGRLSVEELKQYAVALGLDGAAFDECLDSGRHGEYVQRDMQAAFDAGARGTPTFLVNGEPANLFGYEAAAATIRQVLE